MQPPSQTEAGQGTDAPRVFILLDEAGVLAGAPDQPRAPAEETVQEQKLHVCSHKSLLPSEETHIPNTRPVPGWAGISGAPRAVWLGFRAALRHILQLWGERSVRGCICSWMSWQGSSLPFPTCTHSILRPPVPHGSWQPLGTTGPPSPFGWLGKERSRWCVGEWRELWRLLFVVSVLQCLTMGQVPRVVPGYLELSFLSVKRRKERSSPMREAPFSEFHCCGLACLTGIHVYQMINVN